MKKITIAPKTPPPASRSRKNNRQPPVKQFVRKVPFLLLRNKLALAGASAMAGRIVNAIRLQAVQHALETINRESPCLSEDRSSVDCKVGKASAIPTTISHGE
jgi:hypothetical protein